MAELNGKIHHVGEVRTFKNNFRKREVVITDDSGKFTQYIPLEFIFDDCDRELNVGDSIELEVSIGGRKYEKDGATRYFPSITVTKVVSQELGGHTETKSAF